MAGWQSLPARAALTRLLLSSAQKLQREKQPKNLNDTIRELFRVVPGNVDPLLEKKAVGCRRCAVVGNSGNLRGSWYGSHIDSHDFVLRWVPGPLSPSPRLAGPQGSLVWKAASWLSVRRSSSQPCIYRATWGP